jgi:hypothetical protein
MSSTEEDDSPPRKGRSNAILTYETVADLNQKVTEVLVDVRHMRNDLRSQQDRHDNHEVRIRAVELTQAGIIAANTRGTSIWLWVWSAASAVISTGIALAAYLSK